jgi:hypothetical protein
MSRPRWQLRDAALGYTSRGIPVSSVALRGVTGL